MAVTPLAAADARCAPAGQTSSLEEIVARVETEGVRYLFIGEDHRVGPVKRFAVDTVNALAARGHEVGLYVEGFRTDCSPDRPDCRNLAALFNPEAFAALLRESRGRVYPIDPPEPDARVARMAAVIRGGPEEIRVVLVGRSHVIHAGHVGAEHRIFGGALLYPDPGDLAEAFPRDQSLTIALESDDGAGGGYALRVDGCGADYSLIAAPVPRY